MVLSLWLLLLLLEGVSSGWLSLGGSVDRPILFRSERIFHFFVLSPTN